MSVANHQLNSSAPLSSSLFSIFARSDFTRSSAQIVGVRVKKPGFFKCVATPQTAYTSKVSRNPNIAKLQAGYLFPEVARRRAAHLAKYPDAQVISLGIGDTTEPIPDVITSAMAKRAHDLSTLEGYSGYGAEQGEKVFVNVCGMFTWCL